MRRRRVAAALVAVVGLVAGLEWRRVFGADVVALVAAAALLPAALAIAATARRQVARPLPLTGSLSVAGLVVFSLAAVLGEPNPAALLDALLHGWSHILTTTLPVPADGDLVALGVVVTWVATMAGCEVALRSRRPTVALAPPVAAYTLAVLFGIGGPGSRLVPATVALAAGLGAGAVLAVGDGPGDPVAAADAVPGPGSARSALLSRRTVSAAALIAACAAGGAVLGPRLPLADARPSFDPREEQQPPADQLEAIDPMSLLAGWAKDPEPVLFTVTAPEAERWRLAVLDRYSPATGWSTDSELRPAGSELPAGDPAGGPGPAGDTLVQEVTIEGLPGVWLPAADRPAEITGVDPLVDVRSGVLARRGGLRDGLRYRVVSSVPAEAPDCTTAAAAPLTAADTASGLPPDLVELTQDLTEDATSPCARARLIEDYLSSDEFEFNTEAPSGATLSRIRDLLQPEDRPGLGTSEQFATAFALMARATGLPTRVVVGFHGGERVGDIYRVHAGDAFAWAEVRFAGLGWVAFDPTPVPGDQSPPPEVAEEEVDSEPSTDDSLPTPTVPEPVESESAAPPPEEEPPSAWARAARVSLAGLAAVGVVVGGLVGSIALARRIRRRRRSASPDPARRVLGAWRQCLDELSAAGVRPEASHTASDYVSRSRTVVGDEPAAAVAPVARLANGVLFGGPPPSDEDAAAAWRCVDRLSELTADQRSVGDSVRRALDVRVLVRG